MTNDTKLATRGIDTQIKMIDEDIAAMHKTNNSNWINITAVILASLALGTMLIAASAYWWWQRKNSQKRTDKIELKTTIHSSLEDKIQELEEQMKTNKANFEQEIKQIRTAMGLKTMT